MIFVNAVLSLVLVAVAGAIFGFHLAIYFTAKSIADGRMKRYIERKEREAEEQE